ncbi:S-adenosylmethionine decarboxylase family, prokaryotic [uncultured Caudovirales phage]|jgi:S-adenosylmethionine/arginine decarboxylase-like enzyme|uniref:S-adenosylmethionine decarboxylase family, prokaryotic n=1 Tax=uncultured Caudovirales phage TaxID=2100421 RepID=A0A6J5LDG6_9CAUD|nr:S-adenosylmethionine decarboxylase family, prokaryotic [uncultured Caudovirales phage]
MSHYWGYHLILDCADLDNEAITSYENVYNFAKRLVQDIDMVPYGEPQIVNFGSGNKAGFTLVQLIETSNICAHFVPDDGNGGNAMYLDVFSCKSYDDEVVIDLVRQYFGAKYIRPNYLTRQA